jgi:hypothetical protein
VKTLDRVASLETARLALPRGAFNAPEWRRQRARAAAVTRAPNPQQKQLRALERMLRTQAGIPTKDPAHLAPPFSATRFLSEVYAAQVFDTTPTVGTIILDVGFDNPFGRVVPEGHAAEVTMIIVSGTAANGATPADLSLFGRWDARVNRRAEVSTFGLEPFALQSLEGPALLHLKAGDNLQIIGYTPNIPGGVVAFYSARVVGYYYPLVDAGDPRSLRGRAGE